MFVSGSTERVPTLMKRMLERRGPILGPGGSEVDIPAANSSATPRVPAFRWTASSPGWKKEDEGIFDKRFGWERSVVQEGNAGVRKSFRNGKVEVGGEKRQRQSK